MATLIGLGMGIGMIAQSIYEEHSERPSLQWPKVTGTLTQCDVIFHPSGMHYSSSHSISAVYKYTVNNQHYIGYQLALWSPNLQGFIGNFAETHPVPSPVDVYYEPQNPENAVLVPGPNEAGNRQIIHGGTFFLIFGIAMAFTLRPAYVRYKAEEKKV